MSTEESTVQMFGLADVAKTLMRSKGIREGHYELAIEFNFGVGAVGPSADQLLPGAMLGISKIGLKKVDAASPNSIDASTLYETDAPAA